MNSEETPKVRHVTVMDDRTRHIARVYAEALYKAAESGPGVDSIKAELDQLVNEVFEQAKGLELLLISGVSRERKAAAIKKAFQGRASQTLVNFLEVLNHHERLDVVRPIVAAFNDLHVRRHRQVPVHVRSAVPLTDAERQRLVGDIREVSGGEPILHETVDPDILGGLIVRVRDWIYDASVRFRLESVRDQLIERSSHGIERGRDRFGHQ
jgi:F-type H+-transporting ATPase subunit delta